MSDRRRLEEKTRDAAHSVENPGIPLRDRLKSANSLSLAFLEPSDFPDDEGRAEFEAIRAELASVEEASDEQAQALAHKISMLAARYYRA
jgi:hypothetical protein